MVNQAAPRSRRPLAAAFFAVSDASDRHCSGAVVVSICSAADVTQKRAALEWFGGPKMQPLEGPHQRLIVQQSYEDVRLLPSSGATFARRGKSMKV